MPRACPAEFPAFRYTAVPKNSRFRLHVLAAFGGQDVQAGRRFIATSSSEKRNDPRGKPAAFVPAVKRRLTLYQFRNDGATHQVLRSSSRIDQGHVTRIDPEIVIERGKNLLEMNRTFLSHFAEPVG
jgi:hypothetical protein